MISRATLHESLKKADELKEKSLSCQNITNMDIWTNQQRLVNIYEEILILDLEYALDKKVEQDLWNYCFKNYIASLQNFAKDKKSTPGLSCGQFQAKLSWFLECASGFYLSLLQEICTVFSLDLPFKRCDRLFGVLGDVGCDRQCLVNQPKRNSCYYICQYCLVHLGDIARYRNQIIQAEAFYKQAVGVGPWSGQPYNQLALLSACLPDRLSTVFYYVRSIAVAHPFHNALTNLTNTLAKSSNYTADDVVEGKMTAAQYESLFLKLVAVLHSDQDAAQISTQAAALLGILAPSLTPLIATQQFSAFKLLQMSVVAIWMWMGDCVSGSGDGVVAVTRDIMSDFLSGFLTALLLPLYTTSPDSLLSYFALPTIKVLMSWLECQPNVVDRLNKPSLWRGVCKLINDLRAANPVPPSHSINDALPEDFDVRGFLPLDDSLTSLNYNGDELEGSVERRLRAFRLIKLGEWLANTSPHKPICIRDGQFEPVSLSTGSPQCTGVQSQSSTPPTPVAVTPHATALKQGNSGLQDLMRPKARQNVALQSIMRLSSQMPADVGWEQQTSSTSVLSADPRWWPPGPAAEELPTWTGGPPSGIDQNQSQGGRMYSLFSGGDIQPATTSSLAPSILKHQSLWSGPGPSPLERLLQQQKNQRSGHAPDT